MAIYHDHARRNVMAAPTQSRC